jgi:hypothetical protein
VRGLVADAAWLAHAGRASHLGVCWHGNGQPGARWRRSPVCSTEEATGNAVLSLTTEVASRGVAGPVAD